MFTIQVKTKVAYVYWLYALHYFDNGISYRIGGGEISTQHLLELANRLGAALECPTEYAAEIEAAYKAFTTQQEPENDA